MSMELMPKRQCFWCLHYFWKLTDDHVVPIGVGGSRSHENVVRACESCNTRRGVFVGMYVQYIHALRSRHTPRGAASVAKMIKRGQRLWAAHARWVSLEQKRLGHSPSECLNFWDGDEYAALCRSGKKAYRKEVQKARERAEQAASERATEAVQFAEGLR